MERPFYVYFESVDSTNLEVLKSRLKNFVAAHGNILEAKVLRGVIYLKIINGIDIFKYMGIINGLEEIRINQRVNIWPDGGELIELY